MEKEETNEKSYVKVDLKVITKGLVIPMGKIEQEGERNFL